MDKSSKKTSAFGLSGEKIAHLLSIGREEDLSGVVHKDRYSAELRIDGYEIIEKIAEAGQGQVWRAIQLSTGRQVAIKVPRVKSVNSEEAMLRFEREIELVARLKHPNIARIYDSGVDQGQYYYVMDFVSGLNLDEYVRQNKLTHRQVLELVRTICLAVQHAHQNRVIHRDLKPSNIIITGDGHPYIVDFGLAKAILEDEQGHTISMDGETVGTPAYMSPEQAAGRIDEVDTQTDIYSLGVILFNLLTGESPHDLSGSRQQVLRHIADGQVKRPRTVCRSIDRDLEALLLKALDRDPNRRYSTASSLADDIKNYLDDTPLMAGPPSTTYRLMKFVRRNVALSSAVLAAVVILIVGLIITTTIYIQADRARTETQTLSDLLLDSVFRSMNSYLIGGTKITLRSAWDATSEALEQGKLNGMPLAEEEIRAELGMGYWSLGVYDLAASHFERALEICHTHLGPDHPTTLARMKNLGWVYFYQSRYKEAQQLFEKALQGLQQLENDERLKDNERWHMWHTMVSLATVYFVQGRFQDAEKLSRGALDAFHLKMSKKDIVLYHTVLAVSYTLEGRYSEAEEQFGMGLEISGRELHETDWYTLDLKHHFGELCRLMGHYGQAEKLLNEALIGRRDVWGEKHADTIYTMVHLGWLYYSQGRYGEAESLFVKVLKTSQEVLGEAHSFTAFSMHGLGTVYLRQGHYEQAEPLLTDAWDILCRILGEENWATLSVRNTIGKLYTAQGYFAKAEDLYIETIKARKNKLGEDHPSTLESMNDLAVLYKEQGDYDRAEPLLIEAVEGRRLKLGNTHPHTIESMNNLIDLYEAWNKPEKAKVWRKKLSQTEAKIE
jgi:serine/threonine protein kinase/Tfp pilus assembly protein PilF